MKVRFRKFTFFSLFFFPLLIFCSRIVFSQEYFLDTPIYQWSRTMGASMSDIGRGIATDMDGNIFVTGIFVGEVNFDTTGGSDVHSSVPLTPDGSQGNFFLSKYGNDDSYNWTITTNAYEGRDVVTDSNNDVIAAGIWRGENIDFDGTVGTDIRSTVDNGYDAFLTKYENGGNYAWTRTFGGASWSDYPEKIATDSTNNIYVIGTFGESFDFDATDGVDVHTSNGGGDVFITKYTPDGSYVWTRTFGGVNSEGGYGISFDNQDNLYVTGSFNGDVDFNVNEGIDILSSTVSSVFISKFGNDGSYYWTRTIVPTGSATGYGIVVGRDDSGVYVTGHFSGSADFDASEETETHTSLGINDVFITKYSLDGNHLWTRTFGGEEIDYAMGITIDGGDNVFVTGGFTGVDADYDGTDGVDLHSANGNMDVFISAYHSDGTYGWTRTFGNDVSEWEGADLGYKLVTRLDSILFVTGYFTGENVNFNQDGNGVADYHTSNGYSDVFITKYTIPTLPLPPFEIDNITIDKITNKGAFISWETSEKADSRIEFGETVEYSDYFFKRALKTSHFVYLNKLEEGKEYHYKITSVNELGESVSSEDRTFIFQP